MTRRLLIVFSMLALAGCRVDVAVDLTVHRDGSGVIALTASADADVVGQAPGLAEDLRFDDAIAAGWDVDGPTATADGGLRVTVSHDFANPQEATALLASLNGSGGPLRAVTVARTVTNGTAVLTLNGSLRVDGGLVAFADPDLLAAVGATPYADQIAAAGMTPGQAVAITFTADLTGTVESTSGTVENGTATWVVPLDGTPLDIATTATASDAATSATWSTVSKVLLVAFVVWIMVAAAFIGWVASKRHQRNKRRPAQ